MSASFISVCFQQKRMLVTLFFFQQWNEWVLILMGVVLFNVAAGFGHVAPLGSPISGGWAGTYADSAAQMVCRTRTSQRRRLAFPLKQISQVPRRWDRIVCVESYIETHCSNQPIPLNTTSYPVASILRIFNVLALVVSLSTHLT